MRALQCCIAGYFVAMQNSYVMLDDKGRDTRPVTGCIHAKEFAMFDTLVSRARDSIARRRRYNELVNEINSLSERDLADMRASRAEMLYHVRKQIYG
jgi:uncharacterized protein YjiS (DUF1127 family)